MKVNFSWRVPLFYHNYTTTSIFSYTGQYIFTITENIGCFFCSITQGYQLVIVINDDNFIIERVTQMGQNTKALKGFDTLRLRCAWLSHVDLDRISFTLPSKSHKPLFRLCMFHALVTVQIRNGCDTLFWSDRRRCHSTASP
jgi:hypothetical protein